MLNSLLKNLQVLSLSATCIKLHSPCDLEMWGYDFTVNNWIYLFEFANLSSYCSIDCVYGGYLQSLDFNGKVVVVKYLYVDLFVQCACAWGCIEFSTKRST